MAAALRVAVALVLADEIPVVGDSNGYLYLARHWSATGEYVDIVTIPGAVPPRREGVRPPLYPMAIAFGLDTSVEPAAPYPGVYLVQVAFDLVALLLVFDLARRRFGRRAATASAWVLALLPAAVLYPALVVLTEPVAGATTAFSLWCLQRLDEAVRGSAARHGGQQADSGRATAAEAGDRARGRPAGGDADLAREPATPACGWPAVLAWAALAGLSLGVGMLTKESSQVLALAALLALLLLWRGVRARVRLAAAGLAAAVLLAALSPWLAWTKQQFGVVLPSGTYGQLSMVFENWPPGETFRELWLDPPTYPEKIASATDAFRRSLTEHTGLFLRRTWWRLRVLAGREVVLPTYVATAKDGYRAVRTGTMADFFADAWSLRGPWGASVQWSATLGSLLFFALAAAGLAARAGGLASRTTLLFLLGFLASIALIVGQDRYRFALFSAFAPFAGLAVAALCERTLLEPPARRRALLAGAAVFALLLAGMVLSPAPAVPEG